MEKIMSLVLNMYGIRHCSCEMSVKVGIWVSLKLGEVWTN